MSLECPFCKSVKCVKRGKRRNKVVVKQRYICKVCCKQFVKRDGFERMRHKPETIVRAIHMHEDGLSLSKVQNHLWQHDGVKVTRWTIAKWEKKYSNFFKSAKFRSKASHKRKSTHG